MVTSNKKVTQNSNFMEINEKVIRDEAVGEAQSQCNKSLLPIMDVLELTSGKWRISIVMVLMCAGARNLKGYRETCLAFPQRSCLEN